MPHVVPRRAALVAVCALALLAALAQSASARPHRGSIPWSVLLCKYSDRAAEPQAPAFFRDFLTQAGAGQGGAADYWRDVSGGAIDLAGSTVQGWYTMPVTVAQAQAKSRWQRIQDCVGGRARRRLHRARRQPHDRDRQRLDRLRRRGRRRCCSIPAPGMSPSLRTRWGTVPT